jgi:hypothetical protein
LREKKNVSDWQSVKNIIMVEVVEMTRNINVLQRSKVFRRKKEYTDTLDKIRNNAMVIAGYGGASRNITPHSKLILESIAKNKKISVSEKNGEDVQDEYDYTLSYDVEDEDMYKANVNKLLQAFFTVTESMGTTGFLDTRIDTKKKVEIQEELPEEFRDNKLLELSLEGASKEMREG